MRRFVLFLIVLFCLFSLIIYSWVHQGNATDLLNQYQRMAPFSDKDLTYRSIDRSLLEDGLVLYQPTFPALPIQMKADRINLRMLPTEITFRLTSTDIHVAETLLSRDGEGLTETLRYYRAPIDFALKPLETLAILNQDTWKGDIELRLRPQGKNTALTLNFEKNGKVILTLDTIVFDVPDNRLFGWTEGTVQNLTVQVFDSDLLRAVAGYYTASQQPIPESLKQAIMTGSPLKAELRLESCWPVSNLFRRF